MLNHGAGLFIRWEFRANAKTKLCKNSISIQVHKMKMASQFKIIRKKELFDFEVQDKYNN